MRTAEIALTGLANGTYTVFVEGQSFAGVWQATPTASRTWTVDSNLSRLVINEVLADNGGLTLFTDVDGLDVGSVTVDGMTVEGITTTNDNVKLTLGGDLDFDEEVNLGDGDLFLESETVDYKMMATLDPQLFHTSTK